jgi:hypothetical protein
MCFPAQALALQDTMGLLHVDEIHCSPLTEDSILKITGNQAEGAEVTAVPGVHVGMPAPGLAGQTRRFFDCDGQRTNNRALQPREQLSLTP